MRALRPSLVIPVLAVQLLAVCGGGEGLAPAVAAAARAEGRAAVADEPGFAATVARAR